MLMGKNMLRRSEQLDDDFQYNFQPRITTRSRDRPVPLDDDYDMLSPQTSQTRASDDHSPTVPSKRTLDNHGTIIDQNKGLLLEVQHLEDRIKELVQLRKTDAEVALKEYKAKAERQAQVSEELIEALRQSKQESEKEIEELKAALSEAKTTSTAAARNEKDQASHNNSISFMEELRKERSILLEPQSEYQSKARHVKNMYEDLTGLLFTDIKETEEGSLFNCIQTGRKGTIHFKLFQPKDGEEIQYKPMLDTKRDTELIKSLPEYLTNEIEFRKDNASMFLWRLMSSLTRDSPR